MDVKDYCKTLEAELTVWKAKVYDIIARLDKVSSGEKEKVIDQVRDLHALFVELDDRISRLKRECPTEWGPDKIEIEQKISTLTGKIGYLRR
ncbi:MAG: hypothetical protein NT055_10675 [Nitrospirae bacterium]|jgi:hypothetical protein|nr:hypothetical protein [Nitrospirota bacterium]